MTPYLAGDDHAQIIHCAEKYGLLFVMTKKGILYVYEMTSGVLVYWHKVIAQDNMKIVQWCRNCATDGIVIMLNNGDLIHIDVREDLVLDFLFNTQEISNDNVKLYVDLALQFRTQEGEKVVKGKFMQLFEDRQTEMAARVARSAPKNLLRRDREVFKLLY